MWEFRSISMLETLCPFLSGQVFRYLWLNRIAPTCLNQEKIPGSKGLPYSGSARERVQRRQLVKRRWALPPKASQLGDHLTKYLRKAVI